MKIQSPAIGEALRRARLEIGMSQADLARILGITGLALNRVERGSRMIETDWIERMPLPIGEAVKDALAERVAAITPLPRRPIRAQR